MEPVFIISPLPLMFEEPVVGCYPGFERASVEVVTLGGDDGHVATSGEVVVEGIGDVVFARYIVAVSVGSNALQEVVAEDVFADIDHLTRCLTWRWLLYHAAQTAIIGNIQYAIVAELVGRHVHTQNGRAVLPCCLNEARYL